MNAFGPRFSVVRLLGEGSHGSVYRVVDNARGSDVALKTIRGPTEPEDVYLLKQEFRSACDVVHPNLVHLYGLFVEENERPFFTMELVDGPSFSERVRQWVDTRSWIELRRALAGLAEGISHLHLGGRIHRDIKPGNVRFRACGEPVVLDFGLTVLTLEREPEFVGGSFAYLAPEHIRGGALGPAVDWYAFGVMVFEAVTGELPGVPGHIVDEAAEARLTELHAPPWLSALVRRALCPKPGDRLDHDEALARLSGRSPSVAPTSGDRFVGRARELDDLREQLDSARGSVRVVRVHGASGVGKTTLIERFVERLPPEVAVHRGRCHPQESVSYRAFDQVMDQIVRTLCEERRDQKTALAASITRAQRLFPVLSRVGVLAESSSGNPASLRLEAYAGVLEILSALAQPGALVITLDDVQWADPDTGELLAYLSEASTEARILVVLIERLTPGRASASPLLAALGSAGLAADRELRPFEPEDIRAFAAANLGRSWSDDTVRRVRSQTRGSPFFLRMLASEVAAREAPNEMDLWELLKAKAEALPVEGQGLLDVLALSGRPLPVGVALQAAELESSAGERAVAILLRERWIVRRTVEENIEIAHDGVRRVTRDRLPVERRPALHARLARAWVHSGASTPELLLEHNLGAGQHREAAGYALFIAETEEEQLHFRRAAELYGLVARLGGSSKEPPWRILECRARALARSGQTLEAGEAYRSAAAKLAENAQRAPSIVELRRNAAEQFLKGGHVEPGLTELKAVLSAVGLRYPESDAAALRSLAWNRLRSSWSRAAMPADSRPASFQAAARIETLWTAGLGLSMADSIRSAAFQAQMVTHCRRTRDRRHLLRAATTEVVYLASEGGASRREQSRALLRTVEEEVALEGRSELDRLVAVVAGAANFFSGAFSTAIARFDRAIQLNASVSDGTLWEASTASIFRMWCLVYLGKLEAVERELPSALAEARARGDLAAEAGMSSGLPNLLWLYRGALTRADELCRWSGSRIPRTNTSQWYFDIMAQCHLDLARGASAAAFDRIENAWDGLQQAFLLRIQWLRMEAWFLRARCAHAHLMTDGQPRAKRISERAREKLRREDLAAGPALAALLDLDAAAVGLSCPSVPEVQPVAARLRAASLALHARALTSTDARDEPLKRVLLPVSADGRPSRSKSGSS